MSGKFVYLSGNPGSPVKVKRFAGPIWLGAIAIGVLSGGCGKETETSPRQPRPISPADSSSSSSTAPQQADWGGEPWPLSRGNPQCTGVASGVLPDRLEILWEITVPKNSFTATPCLIETGGRQLAVLASGSGPILALDLADGRTVWEYTGPLGFIGSVGMQNDRFFAGDIDGIFYCLDSSGRELWRFSAEASIDSSPNFFEDKVLFTSQDSYLYCLEQASGKLAWKIASGDQLRATPTVVADRAFVAGCDGLLHVIHLRDGSETGSVPIDSPTGCTPAAADEAIFFGTNQAGFFAVDWRTPKVLWQYNTPEAPLSIQGSAAVIDEHVLFGTTHRQFFSLDRRTGEIQWQAKTRASLESSAVVVGESVLIGAKNGVLTEYNWKDGTVKNEYELNGALTGSPAVGLGRVVIATERGVVYCLGRK